MTLRITQQMPNALPGRRYGAFNRPFFVRKVFRLVATRIAPWILIADRQILFVIIADRSGTFTLEV
jgi:hypothetical protein